MSKLVIQKHMPGNFAANSYFAWLEDRDDMLLIDPGDTSGELEAKARARGRRLTHIVLTHGHFDHILGAAHMRRAFDADVCIHSADAKYLEDLKFNLAPASADFTPIKPDCELGEGALKLCGIEFTVMHTPGHTPGGICLYAEAYKRVFTGDTLFSDGFGRTDLAGGSWPDLYKSLKKLFALDEDTLALPGHGEAETIGNIRKVFYNK